MHHDERPLRALFFVESSLDLLEVLGAAPFEEVELIFLVFLDHLSGLEYDFVDDIDAARKEFFRKVSLEDLRLLEDDFAGL